MEKDNKNVKILDENTRVLFHLDTIVDCNFSKYKLQVKKKFLWMYYWWTVAYTYHTVHKNYDEMIEYLTRKYNRDKTPAWKRYNSEAFYPPKG
jgi:hypothetical protein